ncbi:MAG: reductive dehalogenase domain-containing protein [Acidimicrobiales bacterium]
MSERPGRIRMDHRPDAGWDVDDDRFVRFNQVDDAFNRSWWDDTVRSATTERFFQTYREPLEKWRNARGFRRKDYALRNASWHGADIFAELKQAADRREGFLDPLSVLREASNERTELGDPTQAATELKHVARVLGADLVGITERDDRWIYSKRYSRALGAAKANPVDSSLCNVIVIGQAMDPTLIATAPSALAGAATGLGYSKDVIVLLAISQFIRNLGYQAVPTLNDTALAIPYAIKAGLGEYGRHGLVITPEHGANVRFGKIFTDMPAASDVPVRFGVEEMCQLCRACTAACPANAIPDGDPSNHRHNRSNIAGVSKWTVDGEACFGYWAKINSDCSVCIRVCPYTRDYSKLQHRLWARLAGTRLRRVALWWDHRSGRGKRVSSADWWPAGGVVGVATPVELSPSPGK